MFMNNILYGVVFTKNLQWKCNLLNINWKDKTITYFHCFEALCIVLKSKYLSFLLRFFVNSGPGLLFMNNILPDLNIHAVNHTQLSCYNFSYTVHLYFDTPTICTSVYLKPIWKDWCIISFILNSNVWKVIALFC